MRILDISDPANPKLTDAVALNGTDRANDVMIRDDGKIAVFTHEQNGGGITLLDLSDPAHPTVITRFTGGDLVVGAHNLWIEEDFVYVAICCDWITPPRSRLYVIDISDPKTPSITADYYAGAETHAHDISIRDGLGFLSHLDAGLIILDVAQTGSLAKPVELSRIVTEGGWVHNALYWPSTGYVFVGEESPERRGKMHVVDASDPAKPEQVATYDIAGSHDWPAHNFSLDEDRGILYVAWGDGGVVALDVGGELLGDLDRQGRTIARDRRPMLSYSLQLHNGYVYVSDSESGLWVLDLSF